MQVWARCVVGLTLLVLGQTAVDQFGVLVQSSSDAAAVLHTALPHHVNVNLGRANVVRAFSH